MRMLVVAVVASLVAFTPACGGGGGGKKKSSSPPGTPSSPTGNATQQAALSALNALRAQAVVPDMTMNSVLNTSSTKHAGYQAIRGGGLTHYETLDGTRLGTPDTGNAMFSGASIGTITSTTPNRIGRIPAANGGTDMAGASVYYEDISSLGGSGAIAHLWNTVYHRIPMMRHAVDRFGFGDQATAKATYASAGVPSGNGYSTCDFAAAPGVTRTISFWPANGATGIERSFSTNTEGPDPISPGNNIQNPTTPTDNDVGTPISLIIPAAGAWTSVTATVTPSGGSPVPIYILCADANNGDVGSVPATAGPAGTSFDSFLEAGELFILPQDPLDSTRTYTVVIAGSIAGSAIPTQTWSFTTGP